MRHFPTLPHIGATQRTDSVLHCGDYIGATVNLAARVTEHAGGGQLLVTSAVACAARASGPGCRMP